MTTLFNVGDALRGDRVAINARRFTKPQTIAATGRHSANEIVARDNVYCVIDKLLRARPKNGSSDGSD